MSWVRVDDMFWQHPKFLGVSEDALALWIRALAYTNGSRTDGFVPSNALCLLSRSKRPAKAAAELVTAGLWVVAPNGWTFHDWAEYQASRETREKATVDKSRRQQEWRERLRGRASTEPSGRRHVDASTPEHGDAAPIPSHPIPSHPREEISLAATSQPEPTAPAAPAVAVAKPVAVKPSKPRAAKAKPPAEPPHPRHAEVVEAYFTAFETKRGAKPVFGPRDGAAVKALLQQCGNDADRAITVIRSAFTGDPWLADRATIATIASDPSRYLGKSKPTASRPTNQQTNLQRYIPDGETFDF